MPRSCRFAAVLLALSGFMPSAHACDIDPLSFQQEVLSLLAQKYPGQKFTASSSFDVIETGDAQLGLQNLRARLCLEGELDAEASRELIHAHFASALAALDERKQSLGMSWAEARERLVLQIMPAEYSSLSDGTLLTQPFAGDGLVVGVAIDGEATYRYANRDDLSRWEVAEDEVFYEARSNLDHRSSTQLPQQIEGGGRAVLVSASGDGFDAARILSRAFTERISAQLGDPFHAALPNRDFLITWGIDAPDAIQRQIAEQVRHDAQTQSHPLSGRVYTVWKDGRIEVD